LTEATRILAIRHGQTAWNADGRIQGHRDIGLDATGQLQADRLATALADEQLHAIYSSDLSRAADTAAAIGAVAGLQVRFDTGLRERAFGHFEGQSFPEIEQRWPEQTLRWRRRDPDWGPEGGERLADFYGRVVPTVLALAARHPGQTVALVAHGGVLDCLYRAATRIALDAPRTWTLGNASINRLLHADGALVLVGWNDAGHLEGGLDDASA
jgi:probable phosphoglycerate mutase